MGHLTIEWNGERCVTLRLASEIRSDALTQIQALMTAVQEQSWIWVTERVPGYTGLTLYVDPLTIDVETFNDWVDAYEVSYCEASDTAVEIFEIPVCYGGTFGPDLDRVANHAELTQDEVISRHTANICLVHMMGFLPGFAYMGGMDSDLATPRLSEPRLLIEAGSVGIAGEQTGIYPLNSPGGWNIIGRTPLKLFDPSRDEPAMLKAGMKIQFVEISEEMYWKLAAEGVSGS